MKIVKEDGKSTASGEALLEKALSKTPSKKKKWVICNLPKNPPKTVFQKDGSLSKMSVPFSSLRLLFIVIPER